MSTFSANNYDKRSEVVQKIGRTWCCTTSQLIGARPAGTSVQSANKVFDYS